MNGERACPDCGAPVPLLEGFPAWCVCGWNVEPHPPGRFGAGRFAAFLEARAQRPGDGRAGSRALAYAIAVLVLTASGLLVAGGIAAIALDPNLLTLLLGLTAISVGVVMRPRIPKRPAGALLDPDRAPALHALVASVASAAGVHAPRGIIVTADWNASWAVSGLRRTRWLVLGLPLFTALEPQQRVALIAHELGHERAGDLTDTLIVGATVDALDAVSTAMTPGEDGPYDFGVVGQLTRPVLWLCSRPVDALLWLQARLLFHGMQRAEHLADARAADVAGPAAVVGLHEQVLDFPTVELAVQRSALHGTRPDDVLGALRAALRGIPDRERERRRRVARHERTRLTDTHPPLAVRIARLGDHDGAGAAVVLDAWTSERIDAELAYLEPEVGAALVDGYRSALYA